MDIRNAGEKFSAALPSLILNEDPRAAGEALAALVDFVGAILGATDRLPAGLREAAERGASLLPLEDAEITADALAEWFADMDLHRRGELRGLIWDLHVLDRQRLKLITK
jgi:hypothetical protein